MAINNVNSNNGKCFTFPPFSSVGIQRVLNECIFLAKISPIKSAIINFSLRMHSQN